MLAAGGTAAAIALRPGQPAAPEAGIVCLAEPGVNNHAVVLAPGVDPIEGCRAEWEHGSFSDRAGGLVPDLVACIDPVGGAISVFPGDPATCDGLGMQVADAVLDADSVAVIALQERLVAEINLADCQPTAVAVAEQAEQILAESGLTGWRVQINADAETGTCARAGVDSSSRTVFISATKE